MRVVRTPGGAEVDSLIAILLLEADGDFGLAVAIFVRGRAEFEADLQHGAFI